MPDASGKRLRGRRAPLSRSHRVRVFLEEPRDAYDAQSRATLELEHVTLTPVWYGAVELAELGTVGRAEHEAEASYCATLSARRFCLKHLYGFARSVR
jgi:hypothetical protein